MGLTIDSSLTLLVGVLTVVIAVALYVWLALALAAMFRKMGEEAWKGWVPFLNSATVLKWGGFSPWLILIVLIPGLGPIVIMVLLIISAHRINPGFGYGPGMTVLSALLFVVWASILGFGPAPWRGARQSVVAAAPGFTPPPRPPLPAPPVPGAVPPAPQAAPFAAPGTPSSLRPVPLSGVGSPHTSGAEPADLTPPPTALPTAGETSSNGWAPPPIAAPAPTASASGDPDVASWPSEVDDVSAVSPSPFPPSAAAPASRPAPAVPPVSEGLISFVPGRRSSASDGDAAAAPAPPAPVTPVPATPAPVPPAPATRRTDTTPLDAVTISNDPGDDAFPELSGEVSAVVGSPVAGAPMSARSSVSAQQRVADAADEADDVDQTVMVRRKKVSWQLVPASGDPIALSADVVILGRRPAPDTAFPKAQLISVHDQARTVSKTHARLELRGERWLITDLGSTNGVLLHTLMGEEIEIEPGTELDAGERFYLGDEEFRLQHA
jgi:hypothetical protein